MISISIAKISRLMAMLVVFLMLSACIGSVIGAVADTTIAVAKVPFKVGGAIIDVMTPDDLSDQGKTADNDPPSDAEDSAVRMESEPL